MSSPGHESRLPFLSQEVIEEIIVRLPVAALIRFTAVCKQWHSLIRADRRFNEAHFRHAMRSGKHPWRHGTIKCLPDSENIEVALDSADCYGNREVVSISGIGTPGSTTDPRVCGSCDGLLLVHTHGLEFIIWNPYTRAFRRITVPDDPTVSKLDPYYIISGLAYDNKTDDHKAILIITDASEGPSPSHAFVYSARKNLWTGTSLTSDDFPYKVKRHESGITVKGSPHWVLRHPATPMNNPTIISFDAAEEIIKEVPMPEGAVIKEGDHFGAAAKGELLCFIVVPSGPAPEADKFTKLWVREEHGMGESWTYGRRFTVTMDGPFLSRNNTTIKEEYKELTYSKVDRDGVTPPHSFLTMACNIYVQSLLHP